VLKKSLVVTAEPAAMAAGGKVLCHAADAYWKDIGRLDHYDAATRDFEADPARFLPA